MDRKQRILIALDGGGVSDISALVEDLDAQTAEVSVSDELPIFIGSQLPFGHKYFQFAEGSGLEVAAPTVEIWNGTEFKAAVDVFDGTLAFSQSGKIQFEPDRKRNPWKWEQSSRSVEGLELGPDIYGMFWARITAPEAMEFTLSYVGQKFMEQDYLFQIYPDLNKSGLMAAFKQGKTDWEEQIVLASQLIADDLRQRKIVVRRDQIMDTTILKNACRHKTAELIYMGLGNGNIDNRILAAKAYKSEISKDFFEIDLNADGVVDGHEHRYNCTFGSR